MSTSGAPRSDLPREAPARASLVLASLILVAAVANLNLSVANVALPAIGKAFDSSQSALDLIAVGYSLGLAASVLYLARSGTVTAASCCWSSAPPCPSPPACSPRTRRATPSSRWPGSWAGSRPAWRTRPPWR